MLKKQPQLRDYFLSLSIEDRNIFAEKCGTSVGQIEHIYRGNRSCSDRLAIEIDKHSGGIVKCDALCPTTDFDYLRKETLRSEECE